MSDNENKSWCHSRQNCVVQPLLTGTCPLYLFTIVSNCKKQYLKKVTLKRADLFYLIVYLIDVLSHDITRGVSVSDTHE